MFGSAAVKKTKVTLSDYTYLRDIENRLLMSQFSALEVRVLQEIVHGSLQQPLEKLAAATQTAKETLKEILKKLEGTKLFKFSDDSIVIDKEVRRYYESQLIKFEEDFQPNIEFLKNLLKKVPIDLLLTWYAVPRICDDIFESLLEKYLITPKTFYRHLAEFRIENPTLTAIIDEVFHSKDLQVKADYLREKYQLSPVQFEEYLLQLEFNFICCLGYIKENEEWHEVVSPFHEWKEYLLSLSKSVSSTIPEHEAIQADHSYSFGFIHDLNDFLQSLLKKETLIERNAKGELSLHKKPSYSARAAFDEHPHFLATYLAQLVDRLLLLKLARWEEDKLITLPFASEWLEMTIETQAYRIYRLPPEKFYFFPVSTSLLSERNLREVEKSLERVPLNGWIELQSFMSGILAPIGSQEEVTLKKVGRDWKYKLPSYNQEEKLFIEATLFERLWEAGIIKTGKYQGKRCFCLTSFGRQLLFS